MVSCHRWQQLWPWFLHNNLGAWYNSSKLMNTKLLGYCTKTKAKFVFITKEVWWVTWAKWNLNIWIILFLQFNWFSFKMLGKIIQVANLGIYTNFSQFLIFKIHFCRIILWRNSKSPFNFRSNVGTWRQYIFALIISNPLGHLNIECMHYNCFLLDEFSGESWPN